MQDNLQDKLNCMFAEAGFQIGGLLRCIIVQEIDSHMSRLNQLNSLLNSEVCDTQETSNSV